MCSVNFDKLISQFQYYDILFVHKMQVFLHTSAFNILPCFTLFTLLVKRLFYLCRSHILVQQFGFSQKIIHVKIKIVEQGDIDKQTWLHSG